MVYIMKKTILAIVTLCAFTGTAQAYYQCGQAQSAGQKYYNGEISHEEYIDSLTGTKAPVHIQHSDGSSSTIHENTNGGGYILNSDGTSSRWQR